MIEGNCAPPSDGRRYSTLRVGLLLTKVPAEHIQSLFLPYFKVHTELYQRGGSYDVVFCYNLHRELEFIRKHTDARIYAIAPEPPNFWPDNYDPRLVNLCDCHLGYARVGGIGFRGTF